MVIKCTIQVPQFLGSQEKYWMFTQAGEFNTETLLFTPTDYSINDQGDVGKHEVTFHSIKEFEKYRVVNMSKDFEVKYRKWIIISSIAALLISITAIIISVCC